MKKKSKDMREYELGLLKRYTKKEIPDKWDFVDVKSIYDSSLQYKENKRILDDKIKGIKKDIDKAEIDSIKEKGNHYEKVQKKDREEKVVEEREKAIKELVKGDKKKSEIINGIFKIPIEYIKAVGQGFENAFIFLGSQGLGKTTTTLKTLEKENIDYKFHGGVSTPKKLYEFLYKNKEDKVLVFDDVSGLVSNPNAISIILSALWSPTNKRIVEWNSTRNNGDVPDKFVFNSRVIVITNKMPNNDYADVVMSRCLKHELDMDYNDLLKMIFAICKYDEVANFIKKNTNEFTEDLDLRTLKKSESLYEYDRENWKGLVKPMLGEEDEDMKKLKECLDRNPTVKEARKEWCRICDKTRATFYRRKREI